MTRFQATLAKEDASDTKKIEKAFKSFCKELKLKENRFVSEKEYSTIYVRPNYFETQAMVTRDLWKKSGVHKLLITICKGTYSFALVPHIVTQNVSHKR